MPAARPATAYVVCPLCEATCGLTLQLGETVRVTGDAEAPFSRGYLCPKGTALGELHHDPARLRAPLVRRDGELVEVSWEEALTEVAERLAPLLEGDRDAIGVYFGNPTAHSLGASLYLRPLVKAIGTRNVFSAGSVDQLPRVFVAGYVYGDPATVPVPDLDRTDHLLVLGANPLVSNGSLMTAPDLRGRLRAIAERGRVVVVDPVRTRTAEAASEHVPIRPGTDALLLAAMVRTILLEDLATPGPHLTGLDDVARLVEPFAPALVAARTGVGADTISRLARDLAAADRAAVYGRMGTTTQRFGTLTSWLVDVLNAVTGNLDRPGGVMFPLAAAGQPNARRGPRRPFRHDRWRSRVSGRPEVMGELPVVALAEEITTPGPGQVRALVTVAGNPALSGPHAARLQRALGELDLMISLDPYLNETTRHADVVLPVPGPLGRSHYDVLLNQYAVRNHARYAPAALPDEVPQEWETLLRLTAVVAGQSPLTDIGPLDDALATGIATLNHVEPAAHLRGPERLLDLLLRAGPYELDLDRVAAAEHGIDLGPLEPRLPDVLATGSGLVELAPPAVVGDVSRLVAELDSPPYDGVVLVGRRHLRSNNSWMHQVPALAKGPDPCTLQVHPDDAARIGLDDGGCARVSSRVGSLEAPVEVTDAVARGVVSLPHGWGHPEGRVGHRGVNSNLLTDDLLVDEPSGTVVVNGIPVEVRPVRPA